MPALNFMPEFGGPIRAGRKWLTLRKPRADGRDPAPVGEPLMLYTGMRTKKCSLILATTSIYRATVQLSEGGIVAVENAAGEGMVRALVEDCWLGATGDDRDFWGRVFAAGDGFAGYGELFAWHAERGLDEIGCVTRELISWALPPAPLDG